jgi:tight adherence protein C
MNSEVIIFGQFFISVLQFSAVSLLIWTLFRFPPKPEPPVNRRIALALGLAERNTLFETPVIGQFLSLGVLMARRFPLGRQRIRQDLEASGNPSAYSVEEYLGICLASGLAVGILAVVWLIFSLRQFDLLVVLAAPAVGFYVPLYTLHEQATVRVKRIAKKLPYTLDLIALLMEAGAQFTEAVGTLIKDEPNDELNRELQLVQAEIDFGSTRARALASMAERIPLDSLRSVVGAINQAEALGTPLSTILKNQSGMIRMIRSVRAEEASASASMRILIPSMIILLAVVLVVFAPMILRWMEGRLMAS